MVDGNASPLELTWTGIAVLSTLLSLFDMARAIQEVRRHYGDSGPVHGISVSGAAKSVILFMMTVLALGLGVIALFTPHPVRQSMQVFQDWIAIGLIAYQILLALVIVIKDWERWYVSRWEWVPTTRSHSVVPSISPSTSLMPDESDTQAEC